MIVAAKPIGLTSRSQSLPLSAHLAGHAALPDRMETIALLAPLPADQRRAAWLPSRGDDPTTAALAACRSLVAWAAVDPPGRLATARELLPIVGEGLDSLPAEAAFLAGVADRLGPIPVQSPPGGAACRGGAENAADRGVSGQPALCGNPWPLGRCTCGVG